jgi:actin-like ATPase involved in cell morphogenesis
LPNGKIVQDTINDKDVDAWTLKQIIKAIKDVLQETPPEIASDIIDHGIIMTGGSSQLRNLTDLVYRKTGVESGNFRSNGR